MCMHRLPTCLALLICLIALSPFALANQPPAPPEAPEAPQATEAPAVPSDAPADEQADARRALDVVGWLELSGPLRVGPVPYSWMSPEDADPSLSEIIDQLDTVAEGNQYLGVVIYLDQPELSLNQITAITQAMGRVRDAGKTVMTFAESYDLLSYMIACGSDRILLQHKGMVELTGLSIEEMYLAGLLEKIGAKADMIQIGSYKGAAEPMSQTEPSPQWNENLDALLDDLYDQIISHIAEHRRLSHEQVEQLFADSWTLTDTDLVRRRAVDRLVDRDLINITEIEYGESFVWDDAMGRTSTQMRIDSPFALFQMLFAEPQRRIVKPTIAIIHANGAIHSGDSSSGAGLFADPMIGSRTMTRLLRDLQHDTNIQGVIIHIDSPGGSALASEVIWQAVRKLGETKPVYVCVGDMAASGGYYIASAGHQIYANPHSIVGSIGVVAGKIIMGGTYEKLGIGIHRRSRGPLSDMFNSVEPFTDQQRELLQKSMQQVYDQFIDRVTVGRGVRLPDIDKVAEGRLFTGRQAIDNGMADKLGGVEAALTDMVAQLDLEEGQYDLLYLPEPMNLQQLIESIFGVRSQPVAANVQQNALFHTAEQLLGRETWHSIRRHLTGMMMLRDESVLTLMPNPIIIR